MFSVFLPLVNANLYVSVCPCARAKCFFFKKKKKGDGHEKEKGGLYEYHMRESFIYVLARSVVGTGQEAPAVLLQVSAVIMICWSERKERQKSWIFLVENFLLIFPLSPVCGSA